MVNPTMETSEQASTSSVTLPSRKTYITVLSTVAFVSGVGVATIVTIRRGRRMRLEELQNATRNSKQNATSRDETQLGSASAQGPLTLFREMNRAAFSKKAHSSQQQQEQQYPDLPSVLIRQRGKLIRPSVFDDSSTSLATPSALRKATIKNSKKEAEAVSIAEEPKSLESRPIEHIRSAEGNETLFESPVILAVKAIGIATALVGTGALVGWEVARRLLGVQNVDELIDRLATVVPTRAKDKDGLSHIGEAARTSLRTRLDENEEGEEEEVSRSNTANPGKPLPLDEALAALEQAASKGEATTWVSLLSRQLDAEREQDLEERRQRIARQRNAVQEQLSI